MKKRVTKDWLTDYTKFVENSESPLTYHKWAALSLVAALLQRRVFMRRGHTLIYPNMYIVLIGPSGLSRKGEPIQIARTFLDQFKVTQVAEDNSKESIIRDMHDSATNFTDPMTGKIMMQSAVTCFSEELAVFAGSQNIGLLSNMTNWYDSRDKWERRTKHQGIDEINGVCFNFLSASDPTWLPSILPKEVIAGGFTSRIIFVVEDRKRKTIPDPDEIQVDEKIKKNLMDDLEMMSILTGEMRFDEEAKRTYNDWYVEEDKKIDAGKHSIKDPYLAGYISRRSTHLRKVAMCLCATRTNDLMINRGDFEGALRLLEEIEPKMHRVFKGMGTTKYGNETEIVLDYISKRKVAYKSRIMNDMSRIIDTATLDPIIKDLEARRLVRSSVDTTSGEHTYSFIEQQDLEES